MLIDLGLPLALGLCGLLVLYHFLAALDALISLPALLLVVVILGVLVIATIALQRFTRHFDASNRSTTVGK